MIWIKNKRKLFHGPSLPYLHGGGGVQLPPPPDPPKLPNKLIASAPAPVAILPAIPAAVPKIPPVTNPKPAMAPPTAPVIKPIPVSPNFPANEHELEPAKPVIAPVTAPANAPAPTAATAAGCLPFVSIRFTGSFSTYPYRFVSPPLKSIGSLLNHLPVLPS